MLKQLCLISILIVNGISCYAQQDDLIYRGRSTSYLDLGMGYTKLDTINCFVLSLKYGDNMEMRRGWLVDATIQLSEQIKDTSKEKLPFTYFVFQLGGGYTLIPFHKYGFVLSTSIIGGIGLLTRTYQEVDNNNENTNSHFTLARLYGYAEPTITGSYTVTKGVSLGISTSYRITTGTASHDLESRALNAISVQARLIFGF